MREVLILKQQHTKEGIAAVLGCFGAVFFGEGVAR